MLDVVAYDERTRLYTLGPALMELGLIASGQFNDIDIAKRSLAELLETTSVTIVLYRRVNVGERCCQSRTLTSFIPSSSSCQPAASKY